MATSVAKIIGANAQKLRRDHNVTLDRFAQVAKFYGLPWSTGRVGDFEAGRVLPNFEAIYAAVAVLGHVIGRPVSLAELLATDEPVQINDKLIVDASALHASVSGGPVTAEAPESLYKLGEVIVHRSRKMAVQAMLDGFRDADTRMCKTLGVTEEQGAAAMYKLWGRPFSDERDARTAPGANAQRKGQISRQLKAELEQEIS